MAPPGWNTHSQIRDHKLAASIINGHGDEANAVFDQPSLQLLGRFVTDPDNSRDQILKENDWVDDEGQKAGTKAAERDGNLVGYLIARHGTEDEAFDGRDLEMLRGWVERRMPVGERVVR